jgi:hypothetical protein
MDATTPTQTPLDRIDKLAELVKTQPIVEVTEDVYWDALEVVPPAHIQGSFFAMGEAYGYDTESDKPTFYCFLRIGNRYYATVSTIYNAKAIFATLKK